MQIGNFVDKMATFCIGMGIGEAPLSMPLPVPACSLSCLACIACVICSTDPGAGLLNLPSSVKEKACTHVRAAFWKGWDMTLVILAATPVLAGVGAVIGVVMAGLSTKASNAYSKASSIVSENLGNVRTVLAFNAADRAVKSYDEVGHGPCAHMERL